MKKTAIILFLLITCCLTGCGNEKTLTCTREITEENLTTKNEVKLFYKNDKIFKISQQTITEMDEELINQSMDFNQEFLDMLKDIKGLEASYSKEGKKALKSTLIIDYTKLDVNQLKDKFGEEFDESEFTKAKDRNIEDYKSKELEGYTCK